MSLTKYYHSSCSMDVQLHLNRGMQGQSPRLTQTLKSSGREGQSPIYPLAKHHPSTGQYNRKTSGRCLLCGTGSREIPARERELREKWDPSDVEEEKKEFLNEGSEHPRVVCLCVRRKSWTSPTRAEKVRLKVRVSDTFRVSKDAQPQASFQNQELTPSRAVRAKVLLWLQAAVGSLSPAVCLHILNQEAPA